MTHTSPAGPGASRRTVVAAAGASGLVAALAACGSGDKKSTPAPASPETPAAPGASTAPSSAAAGALARTGDIPEGGGKVFADRKVVVTQPVKGEFKAFSAICTHEGCVVRDVSGGTINCPCHGSKFSASDGSVRHGPAQRPLPAERVTVQGDTIRLA
ncbi:Rieske (2Fe-2S) protein [Streptomyces olivoreticuli]|uniref:Rieske (2Fe-2S) protein n=1 Tax=Streptomyces olivoreticuli TaxID=68246 RepID=UPI000E28476E|nr:Rieske (2Fe-2S) protein [Streptomyces olivoreticuli]